MPMMFTHLTIWKEPWPFMINFEIAIFFFVRRSILRAISRTRRSGQDVQRQHGRLLLTSDFLSFAHWKTRYGLARLLHVYRFAELLRVDYSLSLFTMIGE